ncbi:MAG: dihydrolipoamide acetyltransferase family protein [Bacillota bacterium]|nr:dihydrolipoamide acetyltransferase family protein [Bacillota bacterium]
MATAVIMPRQGQSVESCIISTWHKKVGDKVNVGDMLFTYETDKSTFDEEAKVEGTLLARFFEEGDDVECLLNVCVIGNEGESFEEFRPGTAAVAAPEKEAPQASAEAPKVEEVKEAVVLNAPKEGFVRVSPRAKAAAAKANVDYRIAEGTGPMGRIVEKDIEALIASGAAYTGAAYPFANGKADGTGFGGRVSVEDLNAPAAQTAAPAAASVAPGEVITWEEKLPGIRKAIAKSMHQSLSTMAQLTLNTSFDATEIMNFRAKVKASAEAMGLENITLNDIVLFAVSRILPNHPAMNAHFFDDKMVYFKNVQLGLAVDTQRGLMVPTIANADTLSLNEIAKQAKGLAKEAQGGTIAPDKLKGGSFTVTNLGSLGIESFTPVINPPQTGILGVDTITKKAREVNGEIKMYPSMGLSLTFDHRAVDGAPAAKFLKDLATALENFSVMLAK